MGGRGTRRGKRGRMWCVIALTAALLGTGPGVDSVQAGPSDPASRSVAEGPDWSVRPTTTGYRVTLRLTEPAPLRGAAPVLAVDGRPLSVARQSADRRTLTVDTTDSRVIQATRVELAWTGAPPPSATRAAVPPGKDSSAAWAAAPPGPLAPVDPGAPGRFAVARADYDLGDQAIFLPGLGHRVELRGRVYAPRGAPGRRPVVVFLHGRHQFCFGRPPGRGAPWPCRRGERPVPSFRGYGAPATALASHGYVVVSISANGVNAWDFEADDGGARARGQLVLAHLDLWRRWSAGGGGPLAGLTARRLDLRNVGLMGHSRGGEGVVRAALLNAARPRPYGVRAVLPLAPTDFSRLTLPGVAMRVLLPYCDGDVADLQGQHLFDDARYALTGDQAPRSAALVLGANHNFFNTEWTPGRSVAPSSDDWAGRRTAPCGARHPGRLSAVEQEAVGRAQIAGFFRLVLGRETALLPVFDDRDARAASAGRAVVRTVAQAPTRSRVDVARLAGFVPQGAASGALHAAGCVDMAVSFDGEAATSRPLCTKILEPGQAPHWTPAFLAPQAPAGAMVRLRWSGPTGRLRLPVPASARDVRRYAALTFRAAPDPGVRGPVDLTVRVVDRRGRHADVAVSAVSDALRPLPGRDGFLLPKTLLRTVRVPVSALRGLDRRHVRAVELRTDRAATGAAYVADVAFARPSLGRSSPSRLPRLSVGDVRIQEGDSGTRTLDFPVRLSAPSRRAVSVHVSTLSDDPFGVVGSVDRRLVLPPGRVRATVSLPVRSNTRDGIEELLVGLSLAVAREAVVDDGLGLGVVVDDDPTPTLVLRDATAVEGAGSLRLPLRLSAASDNPVVVELRLRDGTAVFGEDYSSDDGGRVIFGYIEPGRRAGYARVLLVDDDRAEPTETFTVQVVEASGAIVRGSRVVTGTIRDDDG